MDTILGKKLYSSKERIEVDKVYKFENLDAALDDIANKTGISDLTLLPFKAKSFTRNNKQTYKELINAADRKMIEDKFSWEMETFNYKF